MENIILIRYEEIFLKGLNKNIFENRLVDNIKRKLSNMGNIRVRKSQSRIYVESGNSDFDVEEAIIRLRKIFGIASVSPVVKVPSDYEVIKDTAIKVVGDLLEKNSYETFKVEARRGDKNFPLNSPQICAEIGAHVLRNFPRLKVNVHYPDFILYIEVREETYLYSQIIPGARGLPTGTGGRATLLLSGGIDSPVAGWMIAKRGVDMEAVYFHSYPYTSDRARDKVIKLAEKISEWSMGIRLHIVPFTEIQLEINQKCPHEYLTIIMRRYMMRIADQIAASQNCLGLITGESIGQVASQTMQSLLSTNEVVEDMPVYRPLIAFDKQDIVNISLKIGAYDTSILPYEDCCTIFVAKHPVTKPRADIIRRHELDLKEKIDELVQTAIDTDEIIEIRK